MNDQVDFFSGFEAAAVYYDKGQHNLFAVLNLAFSDAPFHEFVSSRCQAGPLPPVSGGRLLEAKRGNQSITDFEREFIDDWHFKNVYLRTLNRKELG